MFSWYVVCHHPEMKEIPVCVGGYYKHISRRNFISSMYYNI